MTATHLYLASRGLSAAIGELADVKHHPNLQYKEKLDDQSYRVSNHPGMIAAFRTIHGKICQIHQTYLTKDGQKAFGHDSKRMMPTFLPGATTGGAIRLFPAREILGVAEGIETAIAAHLIYDIPVWACHSAQLLAKFEPPQEVREVLIFADNDANQTGRIKAEELQARLLEKNISSQILMPTVIGEDFNDILISQNTKTA